jgi:rare lipoprotein A
MGQYPEQTAARASGSVEEGKISYYAEKFHGRKTASGERFDKNKFTAAHRSLPFHTKVEVTNLENGKSVVVEVNDRGPYSDDRILDVSPAAARSLGLIGRGTANAKIEVQ